MDGFVAWLKQLQFDGVWQTAVLVAASLLCITFHETCHGLVAYWLGDPTAKRDGPAGKACRTADTQPAAAY